MFSKEICGLRLSALRNSEGMSMKELGRELGISDEAVRLIEKGKRSPSIEVFSAIVDYFDIPSAFLLNESPFEQWEEIYAERDALIDSMALMLNYPREEIDEFPLSSLLTLFGAMFGKAKYDPAKRELTLYPALAPETLQEIFLKATKA